MAAAKHLVIVGAGVFGLFCARAAQSVGWRVSVLDARSTPAQPGGRCASVSAAGMLGPLSETLLEPDGANPPRLALGIAALRQWAQIGPDVFAGAYRRCGALQIGGRAQSDKVMGLVALAREAGLSARAVRGGAVRSAWPGLGFGASIAVQLDDEALVAPVAAMGRLQQVVGSGLRFGATAQDLSRHAGQWRVILADGETLLADEVLLCPGFAPSAVVWAPVLGALTPAAGVMALLRSPTKLERVVRGPGFYLAPRGDGGVVLGSSMQFGVVDLKPDVKELRKLAARLYAFAPVMKSAEEISRWAGVRAMSPDWAPLCGRDAATGILVAAGAGRNGWLYGPLAGEVIAAHLCDRPVAHDWTVLDANRFSPPAPPSRA